MAAAIAAAIAENAEGSEEQEEEQRVNLGAVSQLYDAPAAAAAGTTGPEPGAAASPASPAPQAWDADFGAAQIDPNATVDCSELYVDWDKALSGANPAPAKRPRVETPEYAPHPRPIPTPY